MSFWKRLFGKPSTPAVRKRVDQPDVYDVSNTDDAMTWGIEKANLTLWFFQKSLAEPRPADEEIVASLAEVLETAFVAGIKSDGMPNFSNLKKAFPMREKLGENYYLITEICRDDEGHRSINKLPVIKVGGEWIVLAPQG